MTDLQQLENSSGVRAGIAAGGQRDPAGAAEGVRAGELGYL